MSIIVALFLVACGSSELELPTGVPDEIGPLAIGTLEDEVSGDTDLPLQVWYPTLTTGQPRFVFAASAELGTAQADVAPICETPRPVVMFSHGNGGVRYQSVFLMEHLASNGFIVAAPDHVGNTLFDGEGSPRGEIAVRRPQDITRSFDRLVARSADEADPLAGCVDTDAGYAMVGHSFGGWTTLVLSGAEPDLDALATHCETDGDFLCALTDAWDGPTNAAADSRIWAAIPIAPVGFTSLGVGLQAVAVPTLVIGGFEDTLTEWDVEVGPIYDRLTTEPRGLAGLERTGHYAFTNFCFDGLFPNCGGDILPLTDVYRITNGLALSWLRQVLAVDGVVLPPADAEVTWTEVP
ncbi:MAG: putative dienelactone hydrolase [Myxococcota bacterium]|jgi:predicted dienelactone hydrolase